MRVSLRRALPFFFFINLWFPSLFQMIFVFAKHQFHYAQTKTTSFLHTLQIDSGREFLLQQKKDLREAAHLATTWAKAFPPFQMI